MRRARVARPGALQHRRRRVRPPPARQARDGLGAPRRRPPRRELGRAAGPRQPDRQRPRRARRDARRPRRRRAALDPGGGRRLLRDVEARRDPAVDVGALRQRRHQAPPHRLAGQGARHRRRQRPALRRLVGRRGAGARRRHAHRRVDGVRDRRHRPRRPRPALLHLGHDRNGQGHRPRPPLHPRPRGVHLLPRGPGRRALPRHGRVGVGGRHRAAARPLAPGRRCSASSSARAASTRTSSSTSSAATRSATSSRRRRRCAR